MKSTRIVVGAAAAVTAAVVTASTIVAPAQAATTPVPTASGTTAAPGAMARKYLGTPRSGLAWHSGAWTGEFMKASNVTKWGTWRGRATDAAVTFPEWDTWRGMRDSEWHIQTFDGFRGTLIYGLPLMPKRASNSDLARVAAGWQDGTYRDIARDLKKHYRSGRVVIRLGWEANGDWMSFSATRSTASTYRAAFRRAATVINKEFPAALIDFDINCGTPLRGQTGRLDSLTRLYPGDDVVDIVGCDTYDWDVLKARTTTEWNRALRPPNSVGIQDVADFARKRKKGLSYPEWAITHAYDGYGDNPFYISKMHQFFRANSDVLVFENYFNVPDDDMHNSLWPVKPQNPKAGAMYAKLW